MGFVIRILLFFLFLLGSSLAVADDEVLAQLYDLSKASMSKQNKNEYLLEIDKKLALDPQDKHVIALSNILKSQYYLLREDFAAANQLLDISKPTVETLGSESLQNEYDFARIFVLRSSSQISEAIELTNKLYTKVKETWPKHRLSHLILELSYLKIFEYRYDESLQDLELALDYSFESDDPFQITEAYNMFGIVYSELNDAVSANIYYQKAIDVMEENQDVVDNTYLYANLADSYRVIKQYDKTLEYLNKSEINARRTGNDASMSFTYQMRSRFLVEQKKFEEALGYLLKSKELNKAIGEKLFNYEVHSELANIYLNLGQLDEAEENIRIAEENAGKQGDHDKFYMQGIRARILYDKKMYKNAFETLDSSYENYKEQFNGELTRVVGIAQKRMEKAQLSFENKLLAKENELKTKNILQHSRFNSLLAFFIFALFILGIVLIWFMYKYKNLASTNNILAYTDNLTQLPNRRHVFRTLRDYHAKAVGENFSYSIIIFDIDNFKGVNDKYGHSIGDKVIQTTKNICQTILRKSDTLGRIGGEEFMIILPETDQASATKIANRIREQFESYDFDNLASDLKVTASFGVIMHTDEDSYDALVNKADRLMYRAKNDGRNRVITN